MIGILSIPTADGIIWHVSQQGIGLDIVLIPSGEGDCASFSVVSNTLAQNFRVTTFDMPGFSHTTCPPDAVKDLSSRKLAGQIIGLLDALSISKATMYGCSSGGLIALALGQYYPERVQRVIIHEIPLSIPMPIQAIRNESDDTKLIHICQEIYANVMNEDRAAWEALGKEYHKRLEKNYLIWARNYFSIVESFKIANEDLKNIKLSWTVGGLSQIGMYFDNIVLGLSAGIGLKLLPSKHFPQVSIPTILAEHIRGVVLEQGPQ